MTARPEAVAPLLVFGWGNPSRGDDALGPMFVERLSSQLGDSCAGQVDFLTDLQLQVEHALDLAARHRVLFVDASLGCSAPFEVTALQAARDASFTTHAMSPEAVMQVFVQLHGTLPPPCTLLAIRGQRFELGEAPSDTARANLALALNWSQGWLAAKAGLDTLASAPCTN
jgi:hydrogenase maturation protease